MKTDVLDEYIRKRRLALSSLREKTIQEIKEALRRLSKEFSFKRAILFGSIIEGRFKEDSDIDIAFEGLKDEDFFRVMARLSEFLGRDVDILCLEDSRLREKILNSGMEVYRCDIDSKYSDKNCHKGKGPENKYLKKSNS